MIDKYNISIKPINKSHLSKLRLWKNQNKNIYFYEIFSDIKQMVLPESNRMIDSKLYSSKSNFFTKVLRRLIKLELFK